MHMAIVVPKHLHFAELSTLLTLLDLFAGHSLILAAQSPPIEKESPAEWNIVHASALQLKWLEPAAKTVQKVLAMMNLRLVTVQEGTLRILKDQGGLPLTNTEIWEMSHAVEILLGAPECVLDSLEQTASAVMTVARP